MIVRLIIEVIRGFNAGFIVSFVRSVDADLVVILFTNYVRLRFGGNRCICGFRWWFGVVEFLG